jgi:hypothetical protein
MFGWFKKKQKPEPYVEKYPRATNYVPDILKNQDPWRVGRVDEQRGPRTWTIYVYRFDLSKWEELHKCSQEVIGVTREEYARMMKEHYGASVSDYYGTVYFWSPEKALEVMENFKPYYDSYYMPRAVMDRLACYAEGGFPPYFINHPAVEKGRTLQGNEKHIESSNIDWEDL